jgi:hypothetical protein
MNEIKGDNEITRTDIILAIFIYLSIFVNSFIFFKEPFEFQFGYIIYIPLLPVFIKRYGYNKNLLIIFSVLLAVGIFNIFLDQNTSAQFFKVFTGLALSYFFYDYVIKEYDFNIEKLFKWYLLGCYIAALIGIFQFISFHIGFTPGYKFTWILNKWGLAPGGNFGLRVNSIFSEPTHLGAVLSASFFVSVYNLFIKEPYYLSKFKSIVIVIVYLLSFSGLGQIGIFLTVILFALNFGLIRYIFIIIPISLLMFNYLYNNVKDFRERYDGIVGLYTTGKFVLGKTHGSSFILYNNYHVATENFKGNFLFGSGIGSHPIAFEKHSLANKIEVYGFNLNSADANSMLLRLISETGLFGVSIFLFIIFKFYIRRTDEEDTYHWLVSNGILIMILLNLFRQGHYFLNGFPFFVMLYIYNSISYNQYLQSKNAVTTSETPQPK